MTIDDLATAKDRDTISTHALAKAALRYEAVRSMTPVQFTALWRSAMLNDAKFDDLVDKVAIEIADRRAQLTPDSGGVQTERNRHESNQ